MSVVNIVDVPAFKTLVDEGAAMNLIDVREAHEFAAFRVPGASLHALSSFDAAAVAATLDPSKPTLVLCLVGGRAMQAAELLSASGVADITVVNGGTQGWAEAGYPLEAG